MQWEIEQTSESTIVLRNLKHDMYIGFRGVPQNMTSVVPSEQPFEFKLEPAKGRYTYRQVQWHMLVQQEKLKFCRLYVESNGEKLYLDTSTQRMYPPQVSEL